MYIKVLVLTFLFSSVSLSASPSSIDLERTRSLIRKGIVTKACNTLPNQPACNSAEFQTLSPQLADDQLLALFIGYEFNKNWNHTLELMSGSIEVQPWTSHYWPIYQGGIGARYLDPNIPLSENYREHFNYYNQNPLPADLSTFDTSILSPAEKYDLISGNKSLPLTRYVRNNGKYYEKEDGSVETWMGICHGWAPASFILPRPTKSIKVRADLLNKGDDSYIEMTPDDLKGLGSQLWAENDFPTYFIGTRCENKDPKLGRNGRLLEESCFDTDPAAFHFALIERLGRHKKSFVLDATYSYEVWNQPIRDYKLSFFNPVTGVGLAQEEHTPENIEKLFVKRSEFKKDRFKKSRSGEAVKIIGVRAEISYQAEMPPENKSFDAPEFDRVVFTEYLYDLELNEKGEIIGGEWHQADHPDFLWTPADGEASQKKFDGISYDESKSWNPETALPSSLSALSAAYAQIGRPLSHILLPLFKKASED